MNWDTSGQRGQTASACCLNTVGRGKAPLCHSCLPVCCLFVLSLWTSLFLIAKLVDSYYTLQFRKTGECSAHAPIKAARAGSRGWQLRSAGS
jgi:hypothetical protein